MQKLRGKDREIFRNGHPHIGDNPAQYGFSGYFMLRCFWGRKNWKLKFFYIFATYIQIIIRIMKNLVEKINAEYEVFVSNANAQVEKGNKQPEPAHARPLWN